MVSEGKDHAKHDKESVGREKSTAIIPVSLASIKFFLGKTQRNVDLKSAYILKKMYFAILFDLDFYRQRELILFRN